MRNTVIAIADAFEVVLDIAWKVSLIVIAYHIVTY